jgi:hemoglobin
MTAALYLRLGGAQGIAELVDDIVDRHACNPLLASHFHGQDLAQLKAHCLPFFSAISGDAPSNDIGGNHIAAAGMQLSRRELSEVAGDVVLAMQERGLGAAEVREAMHCFGLAEDAPTVPSLYDRLGRREGITHITRQLMMNHLANPLVKARYEKSEDLARVERRAIEFFCAGTGGTESYSGQDMLATHRGMNISEQEFVTVVDDAMDALQKCGIDGATRNEVLAILWSLKKEVIRV